MEVAHEAQGSLEVLLNGVEVQFEGDELPLDVVEFARDSLLLDPEEVERDGIRVVGF